MKYKEIPMPCLNTRKVLLTDIMPNEYNPNKVDRQNMKLLEHSILEDGLTMPIVTIFDRETGKYSIIDGFHRYSIMLKLKQKYIAAVVLEKDIKQRMASTVRHNRARGVHQIELMSDMVVSLVQLGWEDAKIAVHLGMDADEVLRLKQLSGIAEIFEDLDFTSSWEFKEIPT